MIGIQKVGTTLNYCLILINNMKNIIYILFTITFLLSNDLNHSSNSIRFIKDSNSIVNDKKVENKKKKNQIVAMLLSTFIPGSGQIYNGNWKRGVGYLSIELLAWNYRSKYNDKGDDYVSLYKNYANQHWSFERWVENFYAYTNLNDPVYTGFINVDACDNYNGSNYTSNNNSGANGYCTPWHQAHSIQWIEDTNNNGIFDDALLNTGNAIHIGPIFQQECGANYWNNPNCDVNESNFDNYQVVKDHHFYEGIGKYNLFFAGWDDTQETTCLNSNPNGNLNECRWVDSSGNALSPNKVYYQDVLRTKANKNFDKAENALTVIFVNHVVSVFDIFISNIIKRANNNLDFESNTIYDLNNKSGIGGINFNLKW